MTSHSATMTRFDWNLPPPTQKAYASCPLVSTVAVLWGVGRGGKVCEFGIIRDSGGL